MAKPLTLSAVLAVLLAATPGLAADDEARIRAEIQGYLEAWNAGDAEALASYYDEDGDRANNRGDVFRGREAIRDHYLRVFSLPPAEGVERRLTYHDVSVRIVSRDAAVVDIIYEVTGINPEVRSAARGRNAVFMIERDGRWMRAAHRNSLTIPPACFNLCSENALLPGQ